MSAMRESVAQPSHEPSIDNRCLGTNRRGSPCGRRAGRDGFCVVHSPSSKLNMKELAAKGGKARGRLAMRGKEIPADLRARLREAVDEDTIAAVIVETVAGGSHRERFDAVKLILSELAEAKKPERCICHSGKPGEYCSASSPHGYIREPVPGAMHVSIEDLRAALGEIVVGRASSTSTGASKSDTEPVSSASASSAPPEHDLAS